MSHIVQHSWVGVLFLRSEYFHVIIFFFSRLSTKPFCFVLVVLQEPEIGAGAWSPDQRWEAEWFSSLTSRSSGSLCSLTEGRSHHLNDGTWAVPGGVGGSEWRDPQSALLFFFPVWFWLKPAEQSLAASTTATRGAERLWASGKFYSFHLKSPGLTIETRRCRD